MALLWFMVSAGGVVLALCILGILHLLDGHDREARDTATQGRGWHGMPKIPDTPAIPDMQGKHHPETDEEWSARQW